MKKVLSLIVLGSFFFGMCANATSYNIAPKAPHISNTLKPIIAKYKDGNYIGSMQDLEELVQKEQNNIYAKYYLALCYTRLGFRSEAEMVYNEIIQKDENLALSYYSQRALDCLGDGGGEACSAKKAEEQLAREQFSEMDIFIHSGQKIHPSALDRIQKERMERKLSEYEFMKTQLEQNAFTNEIKSTDTLDNADPETENSANAEIEEIDGEIQSYKQPTNEEIASALNTLSKIGMNPYNQFNPLAQAQQYNQFGLMGLDNPMMYAAMMKGSNPEITKMFLYNQMTNQSDMLNYGI